MLPQKTEASFQRCSMLCTAQLKELHCKKCHWLISMWAGIGAHAALARQSLLTSWYRALMLILSLPVSK